MPTLPSTSHWSCATPLLVACLSLAYFTGLPTHAQAGMQLSASSHELPREAAPAKMPVRTLLLGDARYSIPDAYFYGPLEDPGERQRAVLFSAWLSESAPPGTTNTLDTAAGSDAAARRLVILIESMQAYPDTARRDNLLANYRLYAGDMDITGTAPAAPRELTPALGGLMRVTLRDPAAAERARYPDIFIEGEELRPTTVMGCSRVGVRGVGYAVCSLHFRVEGADISVDMKREHMGHWRTVRAAVTEWMGRYRLRAR